MEIALIDEMEQHLHVRWQRAVLDALTAMMPSAQVIVTSQSPYLAVNANDNIVKLGDWDHLMPDARHPGGPADLLKLLEDVFEVPAGPFISRSDAQRRVIEAAQRKGLHGERIFLSDQLVRRGALFDASGARVAFPEGDAYEHCFVALVNPTRRRAGVIRPTSRSSPLTPTATPKRSSARHTCPSTPGARCVSFL